MVASKHPSKRFIIELCRAVDILNTSEDNKNHFIYFNNYEASTSSLPGYVIRILRIAIRQGMVRGQRGPKKIKSNNNKKQPPNKKKGAEDGPCLIDLTSVASSLARSLSTYVHTYVRSCPIFTT